MSIFLLILELISVCFEAKLKLFVFSDIVAKNSVSEPNTIVMKSFIRCDSHQLKPRPRDLAPLLLRIHKSTFILPSQPHL
jgi:hypothetical protein